MIVLGYNGFEGSSAFFAEHFNRTGVDRHRVLGHDASAALFIDGELVAAAEEERFSREKRTACFPHRAIAFCLKETGISLAEVDAVAFPWSFDDQCFRDTISDINESPRSAAEKEQIAEKQYRLFAELVNPRQVLREFNGMTGAAFTPDRFHFVPHHLAHLFSGYYLSGFRDAAFLVTDGRAERLSSVMGALYGGEIEMIDEAAIPLKFSLGQFYSRVTRFLGFIPNLDEYKVMGLASFGSSDRHMPAFDRLVRLQEGGRYELNFAHQAAGSDQSMRLFEELFGCQPRGESAFAESADIAAFAQYVVERVTAHQLTFLRSRLPSAVRDLVIDGGVALNCVNNSRMASAGHFDRVRVSFAANDCGVSIGAAARAAFLCRQRLSPPRSSCYLGPSCRDGDVEALLHEEADGLCFERLNDQDLLSAVADLLRAGAVIGWVQGRMEFGPRALGHRSILADPSIAGMQDTLNLKIKQREPFRPFAPIVRTELADEVFEMLPGVSADFMTFLFPVRSAFKSRIPAVVHVDGTARVQTVSRDVNPLLWDLLALYEDRFGVPCLVNTSFNVQGEPIVCNERDAVRCFREARLDALVVGNFLITRK